jgi:MFS family permease
VSIANVALPLIQQGLGADQSDQWILSGYALTFGVILVAAGRAGDIMGRGGISLVGVGIFTASSSAAGLAHFKTNCLIQFRIGCAPGETRTLDHLVRSYSSKP